MNSPSNPTGRITPPERLSELAAWARQSGVVLASDECYIDLAYDAKPVSILHPQVSGGSHDGLLAVYSLSKRSNLAGYRAGFVTGDPSLVAELLEAAQARGHDRPGPGPGGDDGGVARRRPRAASSTPGIPGAATSSAPRSNAPASSSPTPKPDCTCGLVTQTTAIAGSRSARSPRLGILVSPGAFYGTAGTRHVRVALTATDERISAATARLAELAD